MSPLSGVRGKCCQEKNAPVHGTLTGVPSLMSYRPEKHFVGEDAFSFVVRDGEYTSAPGVVRVTVDGELRRELDGDASWFGCTAAPGMRGRGGDSPTMSPPLRRSRYGGTLALLFIGLGLVWLRRRSRW
jgi:hypothetical protein